MKSGYLFWGLFFITLGLLYFSTEYNLIIYHWDAIWSFWAAVLVFWGLQLVTKETAVRPFVDALFGITMAVLIFGSISYIVNDRFDFDDDRDFDSNIMMSDMDTTYIFGDLELNGGAGNFVLEDTTSKLIYCSSAGDFGHYNLLEHKEGDNVRVTINQTGEEISDISGNFHNRLEIKLNPEPVWNIEFNIGAAKNRIDLSNFKVRKIDLKSGVTKSKIKLGNKFEHTLVYVDMGVSTLELKIPESSGCKISGEMALVLKDLDNFEKAQDGNYYTTNYESAKNRIDIKMNSGVSRFKVETY